MKKYIPLLCLLFMFDSNATKPEDFGTNSRNITTSPAETLQTIDQSSPQTPEEEKKQKKMKYAFKLL